MFPWCSLGPCGPLDLAHYRTLCRGVRIWSVLKECRCWCLADLAVNPAFPNSVTLGKSPSSLILLVLICEGGLIGPASQITLRTKWEGLLASFPLPLTPGMLVLDSVCVSAVQTWNTSIRCRAHDTSSCPEISTQLLDSRSSFLLSSSSREDAILPHWASLVPQWWQCLTFFFTFFPLQTAAALWVSWHICNFFRSSLQRGGLHSFSSVGRAQASC